MRDSVTSATWIGCCMQPCWATCQSSVNQRRAGQGAGRPCASACACRGDGRVRRGRGITVHDTAHHVLLHAILLPSPTALSSHDFKLPCGASVASACRGRARYSPFVCCWKARSAAHGRLPRNPSRPKQRSQCSSRGRRVYLSTRRDVKRCAGGEPSDEKTLSALTSRETVGKAG